VSALERFFRIFSDLFDGVTKAQGRLCIATEKLPNLISIKGHQIPIKSQSADGAIGVSTSHKRPWPKAFDTIDIFFRRDAAGTVTAANPAVRADNGAQPAKQAPPAPPSRAGRPPLGNHADAQRPLPAANASPEPPDIPLPAPPPRLTEAALAAMAAEEAAPAPMPEAVAMQDPARPAPPVPVQALMDAVPPALPIPEKAVMNDAPPAPPMPEKALFEESTKTAPAASEPIGAEALQHAIKRLKKTTHAPAAGKKVPPEDPHALAAIMRKKIASMHPAFEDENPANAQKAKDEWDE